MINDKVLVNAFIMQLRCYFGSQLWEANFGKILHKQTGCHLLSFSSAWHWTDSVSLLCILRRVLSQIFQYLYHIQANKDKQNRQNKRAGNPNGVNLAALFLCSSDLIYLYIKTQISLFISTSRRYFENKIIVVQVCLFLK